MNQTAELFSLWSLAEERIKRFNQLNLNLPISVINELRSVGYYYLCSQHLPDKQEEYFQLAKQTCQRAIYHALEAEVLYHIQAIRLFDADFGGTTLNIPNFDPIRINKMKREADKIEAFLVEVRNNNWPKEGLYSKLLEYNSLLFEISDYLLDVRPEAQKQKDSSKKEKRSLIFYRRLGAIVAVLGLIFGALKLQNCQPEEKKTDPVVIDGGK